MNKNLDKWDRKIKCSLPAWYVFNCCMEHVKDFVSDSEELKQWEELLDFLIENDYFCECDVSFEEVIDCFIKNDEIRFIGIYELSEQGLEYYAKIDKNLDLDFDLIKKERINDYNLEDSNYITTLKNGVIAIWTS